MVIDLERSDVERDREIERRRDREMERWRDRRTHRGPGEMYERSRGTQCSVVNTTSRFLCIFITCYWSSWAGRLYNIRVPGPNQAGPVSRPGVSRPGHVITRDWTVTFVVARSDSVKVVVIGHLYGTLAR